MNRMLVFYRIILRILRSKKREALSIILTKRKLPNRYLLREELLNETLIHQQSIQHVSEQSNITSNIHNNKTSRLDSVRLYGDSDLLGYYFLVIYVGSPPQLQTVIFDTGSSLTSFPCSHCGQACGLHMSDPFRFSYSKTSQWDICLENDCPYRTCSHSPLNTSLDVCSFKQEYTEGSALKGHFFSDQIMFEGATHNTTSIRIKYIGCTEEETNLFRNQTSNGIMGFAPTKLLNYILPIDSVIKSSGVNPSFSVCLGSQGGELVIGGFNQSYHQHNPSIYEYAKFYYEHQNHGSRHHMLRTPKPGTEVVKKETAKQFSAFSTLWPSNSTESEKNQSVIEKSGIMNNEDKSWYYPKIAWTDMSVHGGYQVSIVNLDFWGISNSSSLQRAITPIATHKSLGGSLIDSGATFTYFPELVYNSLIQNFKSLCRNSWMPPCSKSTDDSSNICWRLKDQEKLSLLPSIMITFSGEKIVEWNPSSYLYYNEAEDLHCLSMDKSMQSQTVLGMSFMRHKNIIFDVSTKKIGIVDASCPIHTLHEFERLHPPLVIEQRKVAWPIQDGDDSLILFGSYWYSYAWRSVFLLVVAIAAMLLFLKICFGKFRRRTRNYELLTQRNFDNVELEGSTVNVV